MKETNKEAFWTAQHRLSLLVQSLLDVRKCLIYAVLSQTFFLLDVELKLLAGAFPLVATGVRFKCTLNSKGSAYGLEPNPDTGKLQTPLNGGFLS